MVNAGHRLGETSVEELLLVRLDGALPPQLEGPLEEHLRICASCREFARRHRLLHEALRRSMTARPAGRDARAEIWAGIVAARPRPRPSVFDAVRGLAFVALVLLVALLAGLVLAERSRVAAPAPAREEAAHTTFALPGGGTGTLLIEQGTALAAPGGAVGVSASAELVFAKTLEAGSAEVRFQAEGDLSYGVLASSPDLAGASRSRFGGSFPRPAAPTTYRLWLHLEADGTTADLGELSVDVAPTPRGEEARPH